MAQIVSPINLESKATWPISLGESITATRKAARLTSIRYNYHPNIDRRSSRREIQGAAGSKVTATFQEKDKQWKYAGEQDTGTSDSYVLILSDNGTKEARLEKLDTVALNITATPIEKDEEKLKDRWTQLSVHAQDDTNEGLVLQDDSKPDEENPYDYRHFLEEASKPAEPVGSTVGTPLQRAAITSAPAPAALKRRPDAASSTAKRTKPDTAVAHSKRTGTVVPEVRLQRKASMRPSTTMHKDEDDGELILENDDDDERPTRNGTRQSAMSMALNGNFGRPISLHSAASSPVGLHSPAPESPRVDEDEIDLGGDDYEMDDGDVEDFDLPSPVQNTSKAAPPPLDADDDDDDFSKELAEAMDQDDDEPVIQHVQEEEESEEE